MKKTEFLNKLNEELEKRNVADAADILEEYAVTRVVYGHLHGAGIKVAFRGERQGIRYFLTSCDALGFCPLQIEGESQI